MIQLKTVIRACFVLISMNIYSQNDNYQSIIISQELLTNANSIIRLNDVTIEIKDYNKMLIKQKRIVTVLNKFGVKSIGARLFYDNTVSIKKLEARIFNKEGQEIKKIKKNEFIDQSAVDGVSFYADNRIKYLDYTPIEYPYTVEYIEETTQTTTAFIPKWLPIDSYYTSVAQSDYKIINSSNVELFIKTTNFNDFNIVKNSLLNYSAKNLKAIKYEVYSPPFMDIIPILSVALSEFDMKGIKGTNENWKDFGSWMYEKLILDSQNLPEDIKNEIQLLTSDVESNIEKAKIVYNYVQKKTRYISVQVGIGGWKPMLASDVDRLGYGDCKALTNYTKTLLDAVGVESYYTVIYGGKRIRNIDKEFSATEGNHVILCLPNDEGYTWLECTSQTNPFGYNANFTDDRDALIIKPEGGEIVHTRIYETKDNLKKTKAKIRLTATGDINSEVTISTQGSQYSYHEGLQTETLKNQKLYYKNHFDYINNLEVEKIKFENNKEKVSFKEFINLKATKYASKVGNRILFNPNIFNRSEGVLPKNEDRVFPIDIDRGLTHLSEYEISIPNNVKVEAVYDDIVIENKFGTYKYSVKSKNDITLVFKRTFILNKGFYNKEDYSEFRDFWLNVIKSDNSRIVLKIS